MVRLGSPFVLKTYQMVDNPSTDSLITWGKANNSFVVIDPIDFSRKILPAYFKHDNFSSFLRQLNIYGFKRVDPNKWEFANESFLRGVKQLLKNITRRKNNQSGSFTVQIKKEDGTVEDEQEEEDMLIELSRLKLEQKAIEDELQGMKKRLQVIERRPQQMITFLYKVALNPDLIPRIILEKGFSSRLGRNRRRCTLESTLSSSLVASATTSSTVEEEMSLQEMGSVVESFCDSPLSNTSPCLTSGVTHEVSLISPEPLATAATWSHPIDLVPSEGNLVMLLPELGVCAAAGVNDASTLPYPLNFLGGGGNGF